MRPPRPHTFSLQTGARVGDRVRAAGTVVLAAVAAFLLLPVLASIPQRLASGRGRWLAPGALFDPLSAAGYVVALRLSFGDGSCWSASSRTGLRVLGASTALPAGALLGPTPGAWITRPERGHVASRALAFVLLTNARDVAALAVVGIALRLRLLAGPHAAGLTLAPAVGAIALLAVSRRRPCGCARTRGARDTRSGAGLSAPARDSRRASGRPRRFSMRATGS
jgi:hypothetical protein